MLLNQLEDSTEALFPAIPLVVASRCALNGMNHKNGICATPGNQGGLRPICRKRQFRSKTDSRALLDRAFSIVHNKAVHSAKRSGTAQARPRVPQREIRVSMPDRLHNNIETQAG